MKKIVKIIFALTLLISIKFVNAACSNGHRYVAMDDFMNDTGITLRTPTGDKEKYYRFKLHDFYDHSKTFNAYCLDPGLHAGKESGTVEFECDRVALDSEHLSDISYKMRNEFDAGLVRMAGYNLNEQNQDPGHSYFVAKQFAIREYEIMWGMEGQTVFYKPNETDVFNAHKYHYVNTVFPENISIITQLFDHQSNYVLEDFDDIGLSFNGPGSNSVLTDYKDIFTNGVKAANQFKDRDVASLPKVKFGNGQKTIKDRKTTITYKITVANMTSDGKSMMNANFDCTKCYGLTPAITVKGSNGVSNTVSSMSSMDLLKYVKNGKGTIEIKVEFNLPEDYDCDNKIQYSLKINYFNTRIPGAGDIVHAKNKTGTQNFLVFRELDKIYDEKFNPCKNEDIPEGVKCTAKLKNAKCEVVGDSQTTSDFEIHEGYKYDDDCSKIKENVRQCVVNNKDMADNSFLAYAEDNKYCSVYCKEDYKFSFPNAIHVNSGRYFVLNTTVNGTRSCYTNKINRELLNEDLERLKKANKAAYEIYQADKTDENAKKLNESAEKIRQAIKEFNQCSEWGMEYAFDPKIYFKYNESYMDSAVNQMTGKVDTEIKGRQYCNSNKISDDYSSCGGSANNWSTTASTENLNVKLYTSAGQVTEDKKIMRATYVKQSIDGIGKYITPTQFYNTYPSGLIAQIKPGYGSAFDNVIPIENGLPIDFSTVGTKPYYIYAGDVGIYSDGSLGRIWGDENSVLVSLFKDEDVAKCVPSGAISPSGEFNGAVYQCSYITNCPDCPPECEDDDGCEPPCEPDNCPTECIDCVIYSDKPNFTYRPVSTNEFNPTGRKLGPNWNITDSSNPALKLKAIATTNEITENGDKVFDENAGISDNVIYKIKLDSKMISKIRKYNKENNDKGGYLNSTLKCYDYKNSDGKVYKNVMCYSTFIDSLVTDGQLKKNISISVERPLDESKRKSYDSNVQYWTLWTEKVNSTHWEIPSADLAYYTTGYGKKINIGPSWK